MKGRQRVFGRISRETVALRKNENLEHNSSMIKNHKNKQNINREVNGIVNAAQTKGVSSPEGQLRTNLSATVDLRKNENLEHNSSMIKNHKTKQNINSEVNGNVNAAQNKNGDSQSRKPKPKRLGIPTKAEKSESLRLKLKAKKQKNWQKWCALSVEERQEIMSAKWESLPSEPWFRSLVHVLPYLLYLRDHKDYTKRKDEVAELLGFLALRHNDKRGRVANKIWHQDFSSYCDLADDVSKYGADHAYICGDPYTSWGYCGAL